MYFETDGVYIKFDFSYFKIKLVVLIKGMLRKIMINASNNLKIGLHVKTIFLSNKYLNIRTERVLDSYSIEYKLKYIVSSRS